jgi:ABC-type multidrug transport system fused ATPase/permease subunit
VIHKYFAYLVKTSRVIGRIGCGLYLLSILASLALSGIEYAVAIFLMVFLFTLGFVDFAALPSWLPFDVRALSPVTIWLSLLLIMVLRGGLQMISYQSRILLTERTQSRLRMVLGYLIFMKEGTMQMPLSNINLYFSEFFPRAVSFIFHFTQISSFFVQALMISMGMFYFARGETLVGLAGLAAMGVFVLRLNRYTHRASKRVPQVAEDLERSKVRAVRNWLLIKVLRTEHEEYKRYAEAVLQYYRQRSMAYLIANSGTSLIPIFGVIVIAAIVFTNAHFFKTPGVHLVAFLYLFFRFQQMMSHGSNMIGDLFTCRVQFGESLRLVSRMPAKDLYAAFRPAKGLGLISGRIDLHHIQPPSSDNGLDGIPSVAPAAPPTIKVDGVSFSWPEADAPVLRNLSLTIPKGSQVGIVGPNGSGKSTLLAVITGVLKPETGCVTIDDLPGGDYLQRHNSWISYVGPEPFLIQGSIRQNLMYSCNRALSDDLLMEALDLVNLRTFISSLPEGLDYGVDESGGGLSSGQKQRLAIARAFLRRPKLLVMDEPTVTIDSGTEALLLSVLKKFKGACTMVIVSHKPEILRDADRIFEITPGKSGATIKEIQSQSFKVGSTPSVFPER